MGEVPNLRCRCLLPGRGQLKGRAPAEASAGVCSKPTSPRREEEEGWQRKPRLGQGQCALAPRPLPVRGHLSVGLAAGMGAEPMLRSETRLGRGSQAPSAPCCLQEPSSHRGRVPPRALQQHECSSHTQDMPGAASPARPHEGCAEPCSPRGCGLVQKPGVSPKCPQCRARVSPGHGSSGAGHLPKAAGLCRQAEGRGRAGGAGGGPFWLWPSCPPGGLSQLLARPLPLLRSGRGAALILPMPSPSPCTSRSAGGKGPQHLAGGSPASSATATAVSSAVSPRRPGCHGVAVRGGTAPGPGSCGVPVLAALAAPCAPAPRAGSARPGKSWGSAPGLAVLGEQRCC